MNKAEYRGSYQGGRIYTTKAGKLIFYTWKTYRDLGQPCMQEVSVTSQKLGELKSAVDAVIDGKGHENGKDDNCEN